MWRNQNEKTLQKSLFKHKKGGLGAQDGSTALASLCEALSSMPSAEKINKHEGKGNDKKGIDWRWG